MAKYNRNQHKRWSGWAVRQLKHFVRQNTPTRVIGLKLGRTEASVRAKAAQLGISLKPYNQPSRRKK